MKKIVLMVGSLAILAVSAVLAYKQFVLHPAAEADYRIISESDVLDLGFHQRQFFGQSAGLKIKSAPTEVVDFLNADNRVNGFDGVAKAADPSLVQLLKNSLAENTDYLELFDAYVQGIYVVQGLGTAAYSNMVFNSENQFAGGFIVMDMGLYLQADGDLLSYRDESLFEKGEYSVRYLFDENSSLNSKYALEYLLVHEIAHILDQMFNINPFWNSTQYDNQTFPLLSWQKVKGPNQNWRWKEDTGMSPYEGKLNFYKETTLSNEDIPLIYELISSDTEFPSLYGASSIWEDFAESFAIYFHSKFLKRQFEVGVFREGEQVDEFSSCIIIGSCLEKTAAVEAVLNTLAADN